MVFYPWYACSLRYHTLAMHTSNKKPRPCYVRLSKQYTLAMHFHPGITSFAMHIHLGNKPPCLATSVHLKTPLSLTLPFPFKDIQGFQDNRKGKNNREKPRSLHPCSRSIPFPATNFRPSSIPFSALIQRPRPPRHVPEREQRPQLHHRVNVPEEDASRQEDEVARVPPEMRGRFYGFGKQDPSEEADGAVFFHHVRRGGRGGAGAAKRVHQQRIPDQSEVEQRGEMDGVDAVGLAAPVARGKEGARVAAVGGAGPAEALGEEFRVGAQCRFDGGRVRVLDPEIPVVRDHPAGYKVVVVGVEGADDAAAAAAALVGKKGGGEEVFGHKGGLEGGREQDGGTVRGGPARDDEDAAVDGVAGGDFKVVPFEVEAAEQVPEGGGGEEARGGGGGAADSLPRAHAADGGVGEGGEEVREKVGRPKDVVVTQDGDFGGYLEDVNG